MRSVQPVSNGSSRFDTLNTRPAPIHNRGSSQQSIVHVGRCLSAFDQAPLPLQIDTAPSPLIITSDQQRGAEQCERMELEEKNPDPKYGKKSVILSPRSLILL
ncbi:choline transporter-like protein 2 isoform X1 [Lates japonicus]|uniref:Choline transporter-like protein 2 isoform X1 n=1 Tax=Lates japonicus TaxID=270547 RepID=A0AAD3RHZ1_LATJO|nr:choline transporter-like protein 2 isoform X1 [Lates japonicus]